MTTPTTRKFTAGIDLRPPEPGKLIVKGQVETTNGALRPVLRRRDPQGINPAILLLNLTIEDAGGQGTAEICLRNVRYEEPAIRDQFRQVEIFWHDDAFLFLPVSETN